MTRRALPLRNFVSALFGTLKLMQMYGRKHDTVTEAIASLCDHVHDAGELGEICVGVRGHRLVVDEHPMRSSDVGHLAVGFLVTEWTRRCLQKVRFPIDVEPREIEAFAVEFVAVDCNLADPAGRLGAALSGSDAHRICVEAMEERAEEADAPEETPDTSMRNYVRGLRAFQGVLKSGAIHDPKKVRTARRAVQGLVDSVLEDEAAILALSQIRGHDERLFHHSLNVCVLALSIGQRLGMSRKQLGELGLAALFHDLGKTVHAHRGDPDARKAPDQVAAEEWAHLRNHPARGARALFRTASGHEGILKAAIAAYEHHAHLDRSGFPKIAHDPHLYSRIVAIADCYEDLTAKTSFRETPYSSHDAFSLMRLKAGSLFDPLLLKVFVNALGIYPVGSLVELTTGEIAMVTAGPADEANAGCPRVRVVKTAGGTLPADAVLDLADAHPDGEPLRSIERALSARDVYPTLGEFVSAQCAARQG